MAAVAPVPAGDADESPAAPAARGTPARAGGDDEQPEGSWGIVALRGAVQTLEFSCLTLENTVTPKLKEVVKDESAELFALLKRVREVAGHLEDVVSHGVEVAKKAYVVVPDDLKVRAAVVDEDDEGDDAAPRKTVGVSKFREKLLAAAKANGNFGGGGGAASRRPSPPRAAPTRTS